MTKKLFLFLLMCAMGLGLACQKKPGLAERLVGKWENTGTAEVWTFNADKTYSIANFGNVRGRNVGGKYEVVDEQNINFTPDAAPNQNDSKPFRSTVELNLDEMTISYDKFVNQLKKIDK